jgi:C4-type Zn-finger protein
MGKDEKNSEIFDEKREKILRNLKGDTEPFTVIIEDPSGKSRINSSKAIESSMEN